MSYPFLTTNLDPLSINARIKFVEDQLVESGEMNSDLRDQYLDIFHNRIAAAPVERELARLEQELRNRSRNARAEVMAYVHHLYRELGTTNVNLAQYLAIFPDTVDANGLPVWDFTLETPLRWADLNSPPLHLTQHNRWIPPTRWVGMSLGSLNALAAPFIPTGKEVVLAAPRPPTPAFQVFRPSLVLSGQPRLLSAQFIERARAMGFNINPNYEGGIDRFTLRNASCPEDYNCSLFITNVDPDSSTSEFFELIHEGAIFSYHRKQPAGNITTAAISLVFTTREAAVAFYNRAVYQGIWIRRQQLRVTWNRERVWPVTLDSAHQTRVLRLIGPVGHVSLGPLLNYLRTLVDFTVTHLRAWVNNGFQNFEIGFASIRGQARNSMKALATYLGKTWRVEYAPDPCDGRQRQQLQIGYN